MVCCVLVWVVRTKYATSGLEEHEPINLLDSKVVRKIKERKALFDKYEAKEAVQRERKNLQKILDNYILICHQIGVLLLSTTTFTCFKTNSISCGCVFLTINFLFRFMQKDCTLRWMILARGLWSSCRDTLSRSLLWERQQTSTIQSNNYTECFYYYYYYYLLDVWCIENVRIIVSMLQEYGLYQVQESHVCARPRAYFMSN